MIDIKEDSLSRKEFTSISAAIHSFAGEAVDVTGTRHVSCGDINDS